MERIIEMTFRFNNFTQLNLNHNHTLKSHFKKLLSSYRHLERHSVYQKVKKD